MQIGSSHNEPISPKFLKFSKKSPKILKNGSKNPQKSNSPFPSMSAAGLLGQEPCVSRYPTHIKRCQIFLLSPYNVERLEMR